MRRLSHLAHQVPHNLSPQLPDRRAIRRSFIRFRTNKRVLVLDDCEVIIQAYQKYISVRGATLPESKPVKSVAEAIRAVEKTRPDIVLVDLRLTSHGEEGLEIVKRIKKAHPSCAVAIHSANYEYDESKVDPELLQRLKSCGADALFPKRDVKALSHFISTHI